MSTVSVIIPNYNHAPFLQQRIESVLEQTYQDFEIIILDDCSSDASRVIIETYRENPKVSHIVYNESNSGSTFNQWQKGLEFATGNWIWIAESDDYAAPEFLEQLLCLATKDQCLSLVYCDSFSTDESSKTNGVISWARDVDPSHWSSDFINDGTHEIQHHLYCRNTVPNASAVVVKKEALQDALAMLPKEFRYAGDWFVWIQCIQNGKIGFVHQNLNYFRQHKQSTRATKCIEEERRRFYEYFYIIRYIKNKYSLPYDSTKHEWIINEWLYKKFNTNSLINHIMVPLPINYIFHYYKAAVRYQLIALKRLL